MYATNYLCLMNEGHSTRGKPCLICISGASEVMDLRKESTTATLLDQPSFLLDSKAHPYTHRKVYYAFDEG